MKYQRKSSTIHFGPRSKIPSRLNMAHVLRVRKSRKPVGRFVSPRMMKIDEEIKKSLNTTTTKTRTIGASNQAYVGRPDEQSIPKIGNIVKPKTTMAPSMKSGCKFNHSLAMSQQMNRGLTLKIDSYPNHSNVTLKPLDLSRKSKMQRLDNNSSCTKRSYSQEKHWKAMPGLVHKLKNRSNLDQGATNGMMHVESGLHGHIGEIKDKHMRFEPLPEPKEERKYMEPSGVDDIGDHGLPSHEDSRCIDGTKDKNMVCELLSEPKIHGDKNMTKKRRKYIETNDDDDILILDHGHLNDEDDSTIPSHHATLKECPAEGTSFVSGCVAQQHHCSSKPINKYIWSGLLKIGKEYVPLAGYLSTKSGEKLWNLSKSLQRVVEVNKVSRSQVWPNRWGASRPTSDNIGMYFFPYKMRPDKYHDLLIKEVMENDLALRAAIDEVEMLIFPSSLLPEHQTFQSKHYLWGVFRPKVVEGKHGDETRHVNDTAEAATAAVATYATTSIATDATAAPTNADTLPTEALTMPKAHTEPTSQGRIDSSMGALSGRVFSFVVRQTPRVEQLIQEIEREGALIIAMQGEMLAEGSLGRCHTDHNQ